MAGLQAYLNVLASWLGYNEKDGTDDIIIKIYNSQRVREYAPGMTEPWCQMTVSAAAYESGNSGILPNEAYCPFAVEWFKSRGQWKSYKERPNVGDIVYYDWSGTRKKEAAHVGTVIKVNSTTMVVREGNYQDALKDRSIELSSPYILGYGVPKWPVATQSSSASTGSSVVITGDTYTIKAGDNLYRVSVAAGCTVEDLCKWNNIVNADVVEVGQVIKVKDPNAAPEVEKPVEAPAPAPTPVVEVVDEWVKRLQKELNSQLKAGLVVDGIAGPKTLKACCNVSYGAKGNITRLIQERLGGLTVDGSFGPATHNAVVGLQQKHKLPTTGKVDTETWRVLLKLN